MAKAHEENDLEVEKAITRTFGQTMGHEFDWYEYRRLYICTKCGRFGDRERPALPIAFQEDVVQNRHCPQNYPADLEEYQEWKKKQQ